MSFWPCPIGCSPHFTLSGVKSITLLGGISMESNISCGIYSPEHGNLRSKTILGVPEYAGYWRQEKNQEKQVAGTDIISAHFWGLWPGHQDAVKSSRRGSESYPRPPLRKGAHHEIRRTTRKKKYNEREDRIYSRYRGGKIASRGITRSL